MAILRKNLNFTQFSAILWKYGGPHPTHHSPLADSTPDRPRGELYQILGMRAEVLVCGNGRAGGCAPTVSHFRRVGRTPVGRFIAVLFVTMAIVGSRR